MSTRKPNLYDEAAYPVAIPPLVAYAPEGESTTAGRSCRRGGRPRPTRGRGW
ncbi:hypothetical protein AB0C28_06035 [Nonomuraea sp. NPDC048892]|uniref:hypothetical protein n=1 Tax=Nonomuraea sp. NPDC048892 TaxID=3154624 RepID=UPI0033CAC7F1